MSLKGEGGRPSRSQRRTAIFLPLPNSGWGSCGRFDQVDPRASSDQFRRGGRHRQGPYQADAPRALLALFEDIANGIEFENRTEHQRITPAWWIHHLAARNLTQTLVTAVRAFIEDVQTELIAL